MSILQDADGKKEDRFVFVHDADGLERCFDMIEDEMDDGDALQVYLVPLAEFVMFDQGTNDESGVLKLSLRGSTPYRFAHRPCDVRH